MLPGSWRNWSTIGGTQMRPPATSATPIQPNTLPFPDRFTAEWSSAEAEVEVEAKAPSAPLGAPASDPHSPSPAGSPTQRGGSSPTASEPAIPATTAGAYPTWHWMQNEPVRTATGNMDQRRDATAQHAITKARNGSSGT